MSIIFYPSKNELLLGVNRINADSQGFETLAQLSDCLIKNRNRKIRLNFRCLNWIDAQLCSALGAIVLRHGKDLITITEVSNKIDIIFRRNGFGEIYGAERLSDGFNTTMRFSSFSASTKIDEVIGYLDQELGSKDIPNMSPILKDYFFQSIAEIFQNSIYHSRTQDHYCVCGQYYPQKQKMRITFTDTGVGFATNYKEHYRQDIEPSKAISWAVEKGHTTSNHKNGGMGLSFIQDFLQINKGSLQIVSDLGYWYSNVKGNPICDNMKFAFGGTIVTIEINTDDMNSYILSTELEEIPF